MTDDARDDLPAFAHDYPSDPRLDALVRAFARGDFRRVRLEAPPLAEASDDPAVRAAALDLRRRIDASPGALALIGVGIALLVYLYLHHIGAGH